MVTSVIALLSLARIQVFRKFCLSGSRLLASGWGRQLNLSIENLKEFHILLQNFLKATILLMLRLIDRDCTM